MAVQAPSRLNPHHQDCFAPSRGARLRMFPALGWPWAVGGLACVTPLTFQGGFWVLVWDVGRAWLPTEVSSGQRWVGALQG